MKRIASLIAGAETAGERAAPVLNPDDGSVIASLALADAAVVDRAFAAARAAQAGWAATPAVKRGEILFRACSLIEERAEELLSAPPPAREGYTSLDADEPSAVEDEPAAEAEAAAAPAKRGVRFYSRF